VSLTGIVQGWVDGTVPNHGVYLSSGATPLLFRASEDTTPDRRPRLEVCYFPFP
jgi:hypothetical protein